MNPTFLEVLGTELAVVWSDGHESFYKLEELRAQCPCAVCAGEPDLFGRIGKGPSRPLTPDSLLASSVERVGNYGIQINWRDGHTYGIWTLDRHRSACPCHSCAARDDAAVGPSDSGSRDD